jgi:hypothetical protein
MSDDEDGAALGNLLHILLDDALALVIERARRFVEDQDPGIGDESAGDSLSATSGPPIGLTTASATAYRRTLCAMGKVSRHPTMNEAERNHLRSDLTSAQLDVARLRAALTGSDDPVSEFRPPATAPPSLVAMQRASSW